jgi:hypothetical protein
MMYQKCIIIFTDGTEAVYTGDVQFDTKAPKKVRRVQFSIPLEEKRPMTLEEYERFRSGLYGNSVKEKTYNNGEIPDVLKDLLGGGLGGFAKK